MFASPQRGDAGGLVEILPLLQAGHHPIVVARMYSLRPLIVRMESRT